jgi:hypothetical protein
MTTDQRDEILEEMARWASAPSSPPGLLVELGGWSTKVGGEPRCAELVGKCSWLSSAAGHQLGGGTPACSCTPAARGRAPELPVGSDRRRGRARRHARGWSNSNSAPGRRRSPARLRRLVTSRRRCCYAVGSSGRMRRLRRSMRRRHRGPRPRGRRPRERGRSSELDADAASHARARRLRAGRSADAVADPSWSPRPEPDTLQAHGRLGARRDHRRAARNLRPVLPC